jgi:hypothetical protein
MGATWLCIDRDELLPCSGHTERNDPVANPTVSDIFAD